MPDVAPGDTLFAVLRRTAQMAADYVTAERSVNLMRLMIAESRRFPDLTKRVANATFNRFRANITATFEQLAAHRLISDADHAVSAQLFLDLVLGNMPVMVYGDWQTSPPTSEELDLKVDLFIQGRFGAAISRKARTATARKPRRASAPEARPKPNEA